MIQTEPLLAAAAVATAVLLRLLLLLLQPQPLPLPSALLQQQLGTVATRRSAHAAANSARRSCCST